MSASFGYYVTKAARLVLRLYREALLAYNITPAQTGVLYQLEQHGRLSQNQLAQKLILDKVNVHSMVQALVSKGFIAVQQDCADKRRQSIYLTETGQGLLPKLAEVDAQICQQLEQEFGSSKEVSAYTYLEAIVQSAVQDT